MLVTSCSSSAPPPAAVTGSTATPCSAFEQPRDVADLNDVVAGFRNQPAALGGDVGADVTLQDGRRLWIFGDTLREGGAFVRNSLLLFDDDRRCSSVVLPPGGGAVIPDRADGVGYWPMSIAVVHRDGLDRVGVMAQRVRSTGGAAQFENLGPALAVFDVRPGALPELASVQDVGPDQAGRTRPTWGAASWITDEGWVYLYGTSHPEQELVFGFALHVARVRVEDVLDPGLWRYWDGAAWQGDPARSAVLVPAVGGVSQTLSVIERDGRWYAISKRDEYLGRDLVVWEAPGPTGPFTAQPPALAIPSDVDARVYRYMPLAHPELPAADGHVVVSVSRGSDDLGLLVRHPELYRPLFVEVPLS